MTIQSILNEAYDVFAEHITRKILERIKEQTFKKVLIGDLFGTKAENVYIIIGNDPKEDEGYFAYDNSKAYPQYPYKIFINYTSNHEKLKMGITHEVSHILNHIKSEGATTKENKKKLSRNIRRNPQEIDKVYDKETIKYLKDYDELNSFYNGFYEILKGKKFDNLREVKNFLKEKLKNTKSELFEYYFEENKEIRKYFLKRLYQDGLIKGSAI